MTRPICRFLWGSTAFAVDWNPVVLLPDKGCLGVFCRVVRGMPVGDGGGSSYLLRCTVIVRS